MPPHARKRVPLNMRTTKEIRDKIEAAAEASGRSLAQEVEYRVEHSFRDEEALYEQFGDETTYNLMRWFALTLKLTQQMTQKSWKTDSKTFLIAMEAIKTIPIKTIRMRGELMDDLSKKSQASIEADGIEIAERISEIASRKKTEK